MTNLYIIIILALFAAAIYGFYWMQKKHVKFSTRVFSALGAGIVLGAIIQVILGAESEVTIGAISWINIVGNGYVSLLQMLVMPLIFVSIVGAFTKLGVSKNLGKISFTVIGTLLATTAVAALIGILSVFIFNLDGATFVQGEAETARIEALGERQEAVENLSIPEQVVSFIPTNVFADLSGSRSTSTIAVVIFSAFIGIAYMGVNKKIQRRANFSLS